MASRNIATATQTAATQFPWFTGQTSPSIPSKLDTSVITITPEVKNSAMQEIQPKPVWTKPVWYTGPIYRPTGGMFRTTMPNLMTYKEAQNILEAERNYS